MIQYTIENKNLICIISANGAEIRSLKNKLTGQEYIWQIDKNVWGSSSPVLFPAIGKIKNDKITFANRDYFMPKHGIIRNNSNLIYNQEDKSKCSFTLTSSIETLKQYPFKFIFSVSYQLINKTLIMSYNVKNTDNIPIHFACGGHTAYACPIDTTTHLSDYIVEFPVETSLQASTLGENGLLSDKKRSIMCNNSFFALSNSLFNEDALVFENIKFNWLRLRKRNETKGIIVRFTDYPHLAVWSKPQADYVCIEPWLGLPDKENDPNDITKKTSLKTIGINQEFTINIETEIE